MLHRDPNRGLGRFEGDPQVRFVEGGARVELLSDFIYHSPDGRKSIAPAGLISDGASVPRAAWSLIGPPIGGPYFYAALHHDARYRVGDWTKDDADLLLWDAALCGGTSERDAFAIAQAVHEFGAEAWADNARKRAECGSNLARLLASC